VVEAQVIKIKQEIIVQLLHADM